MGCQGTVDSATECVAELQNRPADVEMCNNHTCAAGQWTTSAWSACNVTCGTGGVATRTVMCTDASGATVSDSACAGAGDAPATSRACNTAECQGGAHQWAVGEWSACAAVCGPNATRTRDVACVDPVTGVAAGSEAACAASPRPPATAACGSGPCDTCLAFNGTCQQPQGTCTAGVCVCSSGYFGDFCRSTADACPDGVFDSNATCCASGILTADGSCCNVSATVDRSDAIDGAGMCCLTGNVDDCGVCGGSGELDAHGACCASGVTDSAGACCTSGVLDLCGVCDGTSTTCGARVATNYILDVNASQLMPEGSFMWYVLVSTALSLSLSLSFCMFCVHFG